MRRFLIALACCFLLGMTALAADTTISSLKTDCMIDQSGSAQITQTVTVDFQAVTTEVHLPLGAGAKKASVAGYSSSSYVEDGYTILKLTNDAGFSGSRTFTITYAMSGLVTETDGVQTISVPLMCPKWEWAVQAYDFTVTLPKAFDTYPNFSSGYYGDVIEDYMSVAVKDGIIGGTVKEALKDHESMTMTLEVGKGFFSGSHAAGTGSTFVVGLVFVLTVLALVYWALTLRGGRIRASSRSMPPDSTQPGDLPYLLCGGKPNFNMLVCHWASLGYVSIFVNKQGHVILHRNIRMGNERRPLEQKLFDTMFPDEPVLDGASLQYKKVAAKALTALPRYWDRRLYAKTSGNPTILRGLSCLVAALALLQTMSILLPAMGVRWLLLMLSFFAGGGLGYVIQRGFWAFYRKGVPDMIFAGAAALVLLILARVGGGLWTMLMALALCAFSGWQTIHGGKRSQLGDQLIGQALGFRRYAKRMGERHIQMMLRRDPQYFYKMLPYLEAMGLGAEFAQKFGDMELESCEWYDEAKELPKTALGFYEHLQETLALLSLSIRK